MSIPRDLQGRPWGLGGAILDGSSSYIGHLKTHHESCAYPNGMTIFLRHN